MNHFNIWQWTNFVRGLVEVEGDRSLMESHLSSGCRRCAQVVNVLRGVTELARSEAGYDPPEHAIRYAQAIFSLNRPEAMTFPRLIARLVHDSFSAPLPAGLRGESRPSRHALYEAGSYSLDLQLERRPDSGMVTLVGQLADRDEAAPSAENVPVWVIKRKALMASALSNRFGEFQLEFAPVHDLRLRVPLPEAKKQIEISLDALNLGSPDFSRPAKTGSRQARRK